MAAPGGTKEDMKYHLSGIMLCLAMAQSLAIVGCARDPYEKVKKCFASEETFRQYLLSQEPVAKNAFEIEHSEFVMEVCEDPRQANSPLPIFCWLYRLGEEHVLIGEFLVRVDESARPIATGHGSCLLLNVTKVTYSPEHCRYPGQRLEWSAFSKIIEDKLAGVATPQLLEQVRDAPKDGLYLPVENDYIGAYWARYDKGRKEGEKSTDAAAQD